MTTLTLTLDPHTAARLDREAATADRTPNEFVAELLRELADPDAVEGDWVDRLPAEATNSFPPIVTPDEQTDVREEVLDDLCRRIVAGYRRIVGKPLPPGADASLRERLPERSHAVWPAR